MRWQTLRILTIAISLFVFDKHAPAQECRECERAGVDIVKLSKWKPSELRDLMILCSTPTREELHGLWRGINVGEAPRRLGFTQFIKDLNANSACPRGTNIVVQQQKCPNVATGWIPKRQSNGKVVRHGSFVIQSPDGRGQIHQAMLTSYREGNNPRFAPRSLLLNRIVKLDSHHMLGQANIRVGLVQIPVGYFILQKLSSDRDEMLIKPNFKTANSALSNRISQTRDIK